MGVSRSPEELAVKLRGFADALPNASREGVVASAQHVKTTVQGFLRPALGGDFRMSGVGRRGAGVNVRYDKPVGRQNVTVLVRMVGPAHLIERDTKPRVIPKARRRRRQKKLLSIPGIGVRASVNHPGTRGKHPWERGVRVAMPKVPAVYRAAIAKSLFKYFG